MPLLACADECEAVICDSASQEPILYLPWSNITWQRVRSDISAASVSVPYGDGGIECCGEIGGLFPWEQMLRIERNGSVVWDGPVTGWKTDGDGNLTIRARDRFAIAQKRLVGAYQFFQDNFVEATIGQLLIDADMLNTSTMPYDLTFPLVYTDGELITREYLVERLERVYDAIVEICNQTSTGFFTTILDRVVVSEADIRYGAGDVRLGTAPVLSEQTVLGRPAIDVEAMGMATYTYVGAAGQGDAAGFPILVSNAVFYGNFLGSLLESGSVETSASEIADVARIAARNAANNAGPALTLEQLSLSPDFGSPAMESDLSNLLPGIVLALRFSDTCAFNVPMSKYFESGGVGSYVNVDEITQVRLDQIDATVSKTDGGILETFAISCRPTIAV